MKPDQIERALADLGAFVLLKMHYEADWTGAELLEAFADKAIRLGLVDTKRSAESEQFTATGAAQFHIDNR